MQFEERLGDSQAYEARGIVGRIQPIGELQTGFIMTPIFRYLTLDCGKGKRGICVEFVSPAPRVVSEEGVEYLDMSQIDEGMIVVNPGLLYKKIPWTGVLHAEHLKALQTYRPKDIVIADAPSEDEEAIDLGSLNMATDNTTKSAIDAALNSKTKH